MDYAQDLVYLAARIEPAKAASEIKEHFRTGLDAAIQIGMAEHPEWDDYELFDYIKCADRQQQVETAKAQVRKRMGLRATGRIMSLLGGTSLASAPRRENTRKVSYPSVMPKKSTPEWREWCKNHRACFGCGSTDRVLRKCPGASVPKRNSPSLRGRGFVFDDNLDESENLLRISVHLGKTRKNQIVPGSYGQLLVLSIIRITLRSLLRLPFRTPNQNPNILVNSISYTRLSSSIR